MASTDLLQELGEELTNQRAELLRLDGYFRNGYVDALDVPSRARPELTKIIASAVTNWLKLTIETTAERLFVDGFRVGDEVDTNGDVWKWWQANRLDGRQMAHYVETLKSGIGVVGVWPGPESGDTPVIRCESPLSVIVRYDGENPDEATSALKLGRNGKAWLYLPNLVIPHLYDENTHSWQAMEAIEHELGIPFVRFRANGTVDGGFASDLDVAIPIQDRITRTTIERIIAAYFSAFRQRWATGLVLDVDDDGNPVAPFNAAADRLWISDDAEVKFGEFGEASLSNYVAAIEADVQHLAAVTRTPPHYLLGQMVNLSADALVAAEAGLARKVAERQQTFGESWEDVVRLAARAAGKPEIVDVEAIETVWRRAETVSEAQVVDAATKLVALKVPIEALWERIGASPTQRKQWRRMAARDALLDGLRSPLSNAGAADPTVEPDDPTETDPEVPA